LFITPWIDGIISLHLGLGGIKLCFLVRDLSIWNTLRVAEGGGDEACFAREGEIEVERERKEVDGRGRWIGLRF